MPRPERPVAADNGVLRELALGLRQLREDAGTPPYRALAARAHYSASTLAEAAAGRTLPSLPVTLAYVRACGGNRAEWEARWHAASAALAAAEPVTANGDGPAPYAGLAAFQPEDSGRFFGRERLVEELVTRLGERRFLAVFGPSGSGKSSLLRAGLIPQVAKDDWPVVLFTPGERPLEECATRVAGLLGLSAGSVYSDLEADPYRLHLAVRQLLAEQPDEVELLLVVDQFEEIFTLCQDAEQRSRFVDALLVAARAETSRIRVVLGVRADFYGRCAEHPDLVDALRDGQTLVGAMRAEELRAAITKPAVAAGLTVETALVSTIVSEMVGRPGALPLMSHALVETWKRRRGSTLTLAGYQNAGGVESALTQSAERVYTELADEQQRTAREVFLRLIALGDGTQDTGRRVRRTELTSGDEETAAVLDILARARLLTIGEDTVEIAHEALIRSWPRLGEWLADDRDGLRVHRRLTEATHTWESLDRDPGALFRGSQLTGAREWNTRRRTALTPSEREFLEASLLAKEAEDRVARHRTRRLRALVVILAVIACVAAVTGVVAVQQRQAAEDQRALALSREMVAKAAALTTSQPELSILLAVEAYRQAPTTEARSVLLAAQAQPLLGRFRGNAALIKHVAFHPGGRVLATGGIDGPVKLWDIRTQQEVGSLPTGGNIGLAFSDDGRVLVTGGGSSTVKLWDAVTHREIATLSDETYGIMLTLQLSRNGGVLATGGVDGDVTLWDTGARREIGTLAGDSGPVVGVAFSGDGNTLAAGAADGTVTLWNVPARQEIAKLSGHIGPVVGVAFDGDGSTLAVGGADGAVRLWEIATRREIAVLTGHGGPVESVAFSGDGRTLATASEDRNAKLWDVATHRETATLSGHAGPVAAVAFTGDANDILAAVGEDGTVLLWRMGGAALLSRPVPTILGTALSRDGRTLAAGSTDGTVSLWDATTRQQSATLTGPGGPVAALAFNGAGDTVAAGGADGTIRLWDVRSRREIHAFTGHNSPIRGLAFGGDGRTLAGVGADGTVRLLDVPERREVAAFTGHVSPVASVQEVAFSQDGKLLATAGEDLTVTVWDVPGRRQLAVFSGYRSSLRGMAFSGNGRVLAAGSVDGTVKLWDIAARAETTTFTGHTSSAEAVALSADGRTLATAGEDRSVTIWDVPSHRETATLTGFTGPVKGMAFGGDGKTLFTGSSDGTARLWDLDVERVLHTLCRRIGDSVTEDQWARTVPGAPFRRDCPRG
ncbi:hypothetical protein [Amycolatopsis anabasis]|uniref:nSTAND1 domain-containing NTPase n=1 Tax=Amycolatopsis anabasis TaxID=1840409 RepID=UPI00131D2091|nr:hypothetical protein [Amycolatopsis anabasis]